LRRLNRAPEHVGLPAQIANEILLRELIAKPSRSRNVGRR